MFFVVGFFNCFWGCGKNPACWDLKLRFLTSRDDGEMKSIVHIKNCSRLVWLVPKPLLFRNHDCVHMKPGHINCSCFQRGEKHNGFFSVICFCVSAQGSIIIVHGTCKVRGVANSVDTLLVTRGFLSRTHTRTALNPNFSLCIPTYF